MIHTISTEVFPEFTSVKFRSYTSLSDGIIPIPKGAAHFNYIVGLIDRFLYFLTKLKLHMPTLSFGNPKGGAGKLPPHY